MFASLLGASLAQAKVMTWTVDGVKRQGIVILPSTSAASGKSPVVLSFHGHGDNMENFSGVEIESSWSSFDRGFIRRACLRRGTEATRRIISTVGR